MPHVPIYASDDFVGTSKRGLYGDVIQEIDWSVGQILKKLEELDLLDNTLVIFSSDNGPWLVMQDHGGSAGILREGKQFTFDGGMRVPTLAMWKGKIPAGIVDSELATQLDWFPTIAKLTDSPLPKDRVIDGRDISEVLFNTGNRDGDSFLFFDGAELQGYRTGQYKYKMPYEGYNGSGWKLKVEGHDHLFVNIKNDPGERINLYLEQNELAKQTILDMNKAYSELGVLPESLVVKTRQDDSFIDHIKKNTEKKE